MILYRSVGDRELGKLLNKVPVLGVYDCAFEPQTTATSNNVVCFFEKPFKWEDKNHKYFLTVNVDDNRILEKGTGKYYVSKAAKKSMRWTGRAGKECLILREAYLPYYQLSDVVKIEGVGRFSSAYFKKISATLRENNIETDR